MTRSASACVALLFACAACGEDGSRDQDLGPSNPDAMDATTSSPTGDAQQLDADVSAPSQDGAPAASADAGTSPGSDAGATTPPEKDAATRPVPTLIVPTATVPCGDKPCDTLANVCCESWSKGTGFGATQSCVTLSQCHEKFARSGEQNRAIPHECDGKEDCSGGQVCCLYAYGQPLCDFADISMCISKLFGPGGAGICTENDACKLGSTQFIGAGVPLGVLRCEDDADCADRAGTSCQPEESNSLSTGKGVNARAHVKVCR